MTLKNSNRFIITILLSLGSSSVLADGKDNYLNKDQVSLQHFMNKLSGNWACEGGTAGGKKTAAKVTFEQGYGKGVYQYKQVGTLGHTNTLASTWAYTVNNKNLIVSRHYISPEGPRHDMFTGDGWSEDKLILSASAYLEPLWAENRFIYDFITEDHFKLTWEVKRKEWKMGDYLYCKKTS